MEEATVIGTGEVTATPEEAKEAKLQVMKEAIVRAVEAQVEANNQMELLYKPRFIFTWRDWETSLIAMSFY